MSTLSRLLKESWALVEDRADRVAGHFYARLFLSNPQLRELFPVQMDVQRTRLLAAIINAVQTVDDPERFDEYLRSLGRDHSKFHVQPEHYDIVRTCLLDALRSHAGEQWAPEFDQAWRDAYDAIAGKMVAGAEADADNPPYWHAEVLDHDRRTADIAVITVKPFQAFRYRPGQYVSIETTYQPRLWRVYSIANAPRRQGELEFHVRVVAAGWVSSALVWKVRRRDVIRLGTPLGSMTLDRRSSRDVVLVAGGTGLAPVKALVEELSQFNRTRWVHVFYGVRRREDFYDLPALNRLASRYPWLTVVPAVSDEPDYPGERGNISDVVARYGPWNRHDFFVSGSPDMVRATLRRLAEMQIPSIRIKYDAFAEF